MENFDIVVIGAGWHGLAMAKTFLEAHSDAKIVIIDTAASVGGVWAKERLYPGLKTNNLVGSYEFGDLPMRPDRFSIKPGQHIPGQVVHQYLTQFAEHFGLISRMWLGRKVESAELLENGEWLLHTTTVEPSQSELKETNIIARKLVVATGLTSQPSIPQFAGQDKFDRAIFHAKELRDRAHSLSDAKQVAVLGGNKSAWDTCYHAAKNGSHVHMVMRPSGGGPSWVWPVFFEPFKISIQRLATTRFSTWFDPCIWSERSGPVGWIRQFLHQTHLGRKVVSGFWYIVQSFAYRLHRYNEHPETRKLKPWVSPFWMGNSLSIHNYDSPWFDLVRQGKISVYIADIQSLSEGTVHLSNGRDLQVEALVCCTGWKMLPPIRFLPEDLKFTVGLNDRDSEDPSSTMKAQAEILHHIPAVRESPQRLQPVEKMNLESRRNETAEQSTDRYRLYRFLVPPNPKMLAYRNIAFIGSQLALTAIMVAQVQALWVTAYFLDEIPSLQSQRIDYDKIHYETILHNEYTKMRHPHTAGGSGEKYPDLAFDCLSYVDLLMDDLGLKKYRKSGIWSEIFDRYFPNDYKNLVQEWLSQKKQ